MATFEDIRDKHFHLVYEVVGRYGLGEEGLSDLTIVYCEFIHERIDWTVSDLTKHLNVAACKLIRQAKRAQAVPECPLEEAFGCQDSSALQFVEDRIF